MVIMTILLLYWRILHLKITLIATRNYLRVGRYPISLSNYHTHLHNYCIFLLNILVSYCSILTLPLFFFLTFIPLENGISFHSPLAWGMTVTWLRSWRKHKSVNERTREHRGGECRWAWLVGLLSPRRLAVVVTWGVGPPPAGSKAIVEWFLVRGGSVWWGNVYLWNHNHHGRRGLLLADKVNMEVKCSSYIFWLLNCL